MHTNAPNKREENHFEFGKKFEGLDVYAMC